MQRYLRKLGSPNSTMLVQPGEFGSTCVAYIIPSLSGKITMPMIKLLATLLLLFTVTACGWFYKQDVQQGNIITPAQVSMLRMGMTKEQVRYLLGTPVMSHVLNYDRWDYVYTCQKGRGPMHVRRLSLYFKQCWLAFFRESCS
jgi:outer membrane protein assembly factor BamE